MKLLKVVWWWGDLASLANFELWVTVLSDLTLFWNGEKNKSKLMLWNTVFSNRQQPCSQTWLQHCVEQLHTGDVVFSDFLGVFSLALQKQRGWDSELFGLRCLVRKNKSLFVINPENELCWQAVFTGCICICCIIQHHHHRRHVMKTFFYSHPTLSRQLVEACSYAFTYLVKSYLLHLSLTK